MLRRIPFPAPLPRAGPGLFAAARPGVEAASWAAGQQGWSLPAGAPAGGLGLIIFARRAALRVVGIVLIVVPHLIGAPAAPHASSGVPAELPAEFATASLAVAAA